MEKNYSGGEMAPRGRGKRGGEEGNNGKELVVFFLSMGQPQNQNKSKVPL